MSTPVLYVGNKNYSSWSLRGWLCLKKSGAEFETRRIPLDTPDFARAIEAVSPTRRVPVLHDDSVVVWDSLAIAEYANDKWANGRLWPEARHQRALARAIAAEMHSGFPALREQLPMNIRARNRRVVETGPLKSDIRRVVQIWEECRQQARRGSWLFDEFSIADAMFAPVAFRFRTYGITLPAHAAAYTDTMTQDKDIAEWVSDAMAETEVIDREEVGVV